jgi:hypothetical protein
MVSVLKNAGGFMCAARAAADLAGSFVVFAGTAQAWWLSIPASNDPNWRPDVAVSLYATVEGEQVTIYNIRPP